MRLPVPTADRILDTAQTLVQARGFHGFSYKDIAAALGLRHPSIHHHFPTKTALGVALVRRYRTRFADALARIEAEHGDAPGCLGAFAALFHAMLADGGRHCLCGMLGTEAQALPAEINEEVAAFFAETEAWLAGVLAAGRAAGALRFAGPAEARARLLLAGLEGGMVLGRATGDYARLDAIAAALIDDLRPTPPAPDRSTP